MKNQLLFIAIFVFTSLTVRAQNSITVTSAIVAAEVVTVNYEYTSTEPDNYIYCGINRYADATFDIWQVQIVGGEVASSPAANGGTGSFTFTIPSGTTLTENLVSPVNYKIRIELKEKVGWTELAFDHYATEVDIVAVAGGVASPVISFTNALETAEVGSTITVDYEYTNATDGYIYCAIELLNDWTWAGSVVSAELNPAEAGTAVTGSFDLTIPAETALTSTLVSPMNYKIKIELKTGSEGTWLANASPGTEIDLTAAVAGIGDLNGANNISIYPNPVSNELNISNIDMSEVKSIKVLNILGKVVVSQLSFDTNTIDVSTLVQGVYCLVISTERGTKQTKFIKK
jgi:hypothetical protein